jgi:hypothetical protein
MLFERVGQEEQALLEAPVFRLMAYRAHSSRIVYRPR